MSDIKPIETVYNGYRFRSRLEARWAVFLDEVRVEYQYELEGYELGAGIKYLPDFFLPSIGVHVEVKPNRDFLTDKATIKKLLLFAVDGNMPLVIIAGSPGSEAMAQPGVKLAFANQQMAHWMLPSALLKARQARFEHGATPRAPQ